MHPRTVQRWWEVDFGTSKLRNGYLVPSENHTSIFPHATDACNNCAAMDIEEAQYNSALKKHGMQDDQGSMSRVTAIDDEKAALLDLKVERKRHRNEASAAMEVHKKCTIHVAKQYAEVEDAYNLFLRKGRSATALDMERVADAAMGLKFDMSTDFRQDKGIPFWNRSAQPGATYFMSNVTHYVHILCLHS